jgi:hypothetical protein
MNPNSHDDEVNRWIEYLTDSARTPKEYADCLTQLERNNPAIFAELKVWPTAKVLQHSTGSINPGEDRDHRSCFLVSLRSNHRVLVC